MNPVEGLRGRVTAVVLAGGASRRMGPVGAGGKALVPLAGRPLLDHVVSRLEPQVQELWLSLPPGGRLPGFDKYRIIEDQELSLRGPLAGLGAALTALAQNKRVTSYEASEQWLAMAPCDTPFLPQDFVQRLAQSAQAGDQAVVARDPARVHPACSLWRPDALPTVLEALKREKGPGLMDVLGRVPHTEVIWDEALPPSFYNVNGQQELLQAARWLDLAGGTTDDALSPEHSLSQKDD